VAHPARALRGGQISGTRGGLDFDGGNEGNAFGVPAAGVRHRDDRWSPLPNRRMKLAVRAGFRFAWKSVTRLEWWASSRPRTAAYARIR
jgi:hypothetical protein